MAEVAGPFAVAETCGRIAGLLNRWASALPAYALEAARPPAPPRAPRTRNAEEERARRRPPTAVHPPRALTPRTRPRHRTRGRGFEGKEKRRGTKGRGRFRCGSGWGEMGAGAEGRRAKRQGGAREWGS